MVMWVLEPGFLAFYPTADQRIKGKVTACMHLGTKVWVTWRQFSEVARVNSDSCSVVNTQAPPAGEAGEDVDSAWDSMAHTPAYGL